MVLTLLSAVKQISCIKHVFFCQEREPVSPEPRLPSPRPHQPPFHRTLHCQVAFHIERHLGDTVPFQFNVPQIGSNRICLITPGVGQTECFRPTEPMYFVFCRLYSFSPQHLTCPTCHFSTLNLHCIAGVGLPNHMMGEFFVGPIKKTISGL